MKLRRVISGTGRTLIALGLLILLFVAYELWGTGIAEARNQSKLKDSFAQTLGKPAPSAPTTAPGGPPSPTTSLPPAPDGEAVAIISIPKLGLEKAVVEGVGVPDLKKGPGHYPKTPMPGQPGNAAIAGHRTTYGAPFENLDNLVAGDPIVVTTRTGKYRYLVTQSMVVKPEEVSVLDPTPDNRLTLTTCNPKYSAAERLIVLARLEGNAVEAPAPATPPGEAKPVAQTTTKDSGLSGDPTARGPVLMWGTVAAVVFFAVWMLSRVWRRWPAFLLGAPVFFVVLFVFYENVARLLPANI